MIRLSPTIRRTARRLLLLVSVLSRLATPAEGCRYNVRDLGFIDLEAHAYQLRIPQPPTLDPDRKRRISEIAETAFADSNLRLEWVANDPAQENAAPNLQSPDGENLKLPPIDLAGATPSKLAETFSALVESPARETLVGAVAEDFAVLVLVEGSEPGANRRAHQTANEAIERIRAAMKTLPKAIARPPRLLPIRPQDTAHEAILLWALGAGGAASSTEPVLAIVYGQARRVGPLLRGDAIRGDRIHQVLATLGADCECGLDLTWTRGKSLPVRWPESAHTRVAKDLGFDPESPRVKLEAAQILGKSAPAVAPALGYREIALDEPAGAPGNPTHPASPEPGVVAATEPAPPPIARFPGSTWLVLGAGGLLVVVTGLGILFRSTT